MKTFIRSAHFICLILIILVVSSCSKQTEKITSISQLKDKRICILTGSAADLAAKEAFPNAHFLEMVEAADAALSVKIGKADAYIHDRSSLEKIAENNPELTLLDERISELEIAAAVNKNNKELLEQINTLFKQLDADGVLKQLREKWIDTKYTSVPYYPSYDYEAPNGVLKVGTYAVYEPYSFISNGIFTGIDIELAELIGKYLGKKIEITNIIFEGLIPALQSGKIDLALSNFTVTEERKKLISFSMPYVVSDISVLVKK